MDKPKKLAVEVFPARDGGYVVLPAINPGVLREPLFAGALIDCLSYIFREYTGVNNAFVEAATTELV